MYVLLQYIKGLFEGTLSGSNDVNPKAVAAPENVQISFFSSLLDFALILPTTAAAGK
jgi:hypothetical protein